MLDCLTQSGKLSDWSNGGHDLAKKRNHAKPRTTAKKEATLIKKPGYLSRRTTFQGSITSLEIVVIDDRIAFVGGIDLSRWRWDSNAHKADDPRRIDPDGKPYPPFHDLMMLVEGDAARRLGDLARKRWRCAHGWRINPVKNQQADPWPDLVKPGIKQQSIAIARTEPAFKGQQAVNEIRQLYLDAITAASHSIYTENQYFTASCLANALCESLSNEEGPQVVLVLPLKTGGWLEQVTMDVLRARLLKRLAERGTVAVSLLRLVPIAPFAVLSSQVQTISTGQHYRVGPWIGRDHFFFKHPLGCDHQPQLADNDSGHSYRWTAIVHCQFNQALAAHQLKY